MSIFRIKKYSKILCHKFTKYDIIIITILRFDFIDTSKISHVHSEIGLLHTSHLIVRYLQQKQNYRRWLMGNIIESVVECGSVYGIVCVIASFIFFYATIRFVSPYIYKIVCKICNTLVKYKDVHAKANVKDVSFETELHR